jgi:hypothetical protein
MQLKFAVSAGLALLIAAAAPSVRADKKQPKDEEVPSNINKQFQWEDKVVGPKAGIDRDKIAATQERGRREEEARKKEPAKKQERAQGIDAPASASLPTMDIEKPASAPTKKQPKKVAEAKQKDALDNLLDDQGVKPNRPDGSGDGLGGMFASDDKGASKKTAGKKSGKRH